MLFSSLQQHGGGEDNGDPVLMVRKVRLQDLIAFLKVHPVATNAEYILNSGLLKYFSLVLLILYCLYSDNFE